MIAPETPSREEAERDVLEAFSRAIEAGHGFEPTFGLAQPDGKPLSWDDAEKARKAPKWRTVPEGEAIEHEEEDCE